MAADGSNGTPITWRDLERIGVIGENGHGKRIDSLESRWDRLAGAFAVPAFLLIVSNLILALVAIAVLVRG